MKYTGLTPTDVNKVASGSLGVFVENTQVGTFGTDSLVVTGSTTLSGSVSVVGPQTNRGNLTVTGSSTLSGSLINIGPISQIGQVNIEGNTVITGSTTVSSSLTVVGEQNILGALTTIGSFLTTGSAIISSSLSVIGTETVTGVLQAIGSFFTTGSAIISSSLSVIGTSTVQGTSIVSGSSNITGSLSVQGPAVVTGSAYVTGTTDVLTAQGSQADGTLLNILGTSGQLFSVTDGLSGSLFSVNTISGLPVLEAFSDFSFVAGQYGVNNLFVKDGKVGIMTGVPQSTLDVVGSTRITGSAVLTGSLDIQAPDGTKLAANSTDYLRVGSSASPYLLVTGSSGRVSVGTTSSVSTLNVGGTTNVLTVQGTTTEGNMFDVYGPSGQLFSVIDGLSGSLFSVNTISGVPVMEVFSDNTVNIGQYSNPPLIVSGSTVRISGSATINSGNLAINTGSLTIFKSGSGASDPLFDVEGAQGQLFSVIDSFSGSLMSVNDISGFPILDVRSDDTIIMGTFGSDAFKVAGTAVSVGVTASAVPTTTGSNGEFRFGIVGGSAFMYVYLGGKWRSGSLSN